MFGIESGGSRTLTHERKLLKWFGSDIQGCNRSVWFDFWRENIWTNKK